MFQASVLLALAADRRRAGVRWAPALLIVAARTKAPPGYAFPAPNPLDTERREVYN